MGKYTITVRVPDMESVLFDIVYIATVGEGGSFGLSDIVANSFNKEELIEAIKWALTQEDIKEITIREKN